MIEEEIINYFKKEIEEFKQINEKFSHFLLLSPDIDLLIYLIKFFKKISNKKFYHLNSNKNLSVLYNFLENSEIIFYTNNAYLIDNLERRLRSRFNHRIILFDYYLNKPFYFTINENLRKKYNLQKYDIFTSLNKIDYLLLFISQEIKIPDFNLTYRKYLYLTINLPFLYKIKKTVIFRHFIILKRSAFFFNNKFLWHFNEIEEQSKKIFSVIERNELRKIKF